MEFLRELLAKFEIEVDGADQVEKAAGDLDSGADAAENFGAELLIMGGAIVAATAALTAGAVAMYSFVEGTTAAVDETGKLSTTLGVNTDTLQKWNFVAGEAGGSGADVSAAMRRLSKNLFDAQRTAGPASEAFEKLGVAVTDSSGNTRDLEDVLLDTAVAIGATENNADKLALAQETLGRGALKLIPGFKGTREEMQGVLDTAGDLNGLISEDFIKGSEAFNDNVSQMGNQFFKLRAIIADVFLPVTKFFVEGLRDMANSVGEWLEQTQIIDRVVKFGGLASLGALIKFLTVGLAKWVVNWRLIGTLISRAFTFLRPWIGIIAKFLIWALILDDIIVFLQGGESALGKFLDAALGVGAAEETLKTLRALWDAAKTGINLAATAVLDFLTDMGLITPDAEEAGQGFADGWQPVIKVLGTVLGLVKDLIAAFTELEAFQNIADKIFAASDEEANTRATFEADNAGNGPVADRFEALRRARAAAKDRRTPATAPGAAAGSGSSTSVVDQSTTTVNLSGPQTPQTVSRAAREAQAITRTRGTQKAANALVRGGQ